jgi:hypothetical protein
MASMSCPAHRDIDHAYSTSVTERIRRLQRVKGAKKVLEMNSGQLTEALHSKDYSKLAAEELAKAVVRHNKTHPVAKAPKPRMGQLRGIKCFRQLQNTTAEIIRQTRNRTSSAGRHKILRNPSGPAPGA